MTDQWEHWRRSLADPSLIGSPDLPVHADRPQSGFYRMETGAGWVPVAYWRDDAGAEQCLVDGKATTGGNNIWLRCCEHPISEAAYSYARDTGEWGDVDPATANTSNVLVPENDLKAWGGQVALAVKGSAAYATVTDDGTAARAQSLRAKLQELAKTADKRREELKRPHLEAGRLVDDAWRPIITGARNAAGAIAKAISAFETSKLDARINEPLPTQIRGGYGTATPIREVREIDEITDWAALFAHFVNDGPAREYMRVRAERELATGGTPPGLTVKTVRRVGPK